MRNFVFLTSALGRSGNAVAGYGPAGIIRRTSSTLTVWESGLKYLALFLDNDDADDTNNINTTSPAHHSYMHPFLRPVKIGFVQPSRAKQSQAKLDLLKPQGKFSKRLRHPAIPEAGDCWLKEMDIYHMSP